MVLPLLLEDHVQALQHGVVFPRVAGAVGRDAVPLQLLRVKAAITSRTSSMRSRRRPSTWSRDGSASGSRPQRRGLVSHDPRQAPRVVRVGRPLHHPPQPAVRGKHKVTVRLHEAPLAIDLLVEDRLGQLPPRAIVPLQMSWIIAQASLRPSGSAAFSLSRSAVSLTLSALRLSTWAAYEGAPPRSR